MLIYIFVVLVCAALLAFAIKKITEHKTAKALRLWGLVLIAVGLIASLLQPELARATDANQLDYLKNTFLIIAAIGANFVAASAVAKDPSCACKCQCETAQSSPPQQRAPADAEVKSVDPR